MKKLTNVSIFLLVGIFLVACSSKIRPEGEIEDDVQPISSIEPVSHGLEVKDQVSFIDALRTKYTVEIVETENAYKENESYLYDSSSVTNLKIADLGDAEIKVFEYSDETTAENDISKFSADGSQYNSTSMISWVSPPHFYHKGNIIVLYAGSNSAVITALEDVLGDQIAGR